MISPPLETSDTYPPFPEVPGLQASQRVYTSSTMIEHQALHRRLVILGGCLSGLEFALTYAQFGSSVTILKAAYTFQLRNEADVEDIICKVLTHKSIDVVTGGWLHRIEPGAGADTVVCEDKYGILRHLTASAILVAAGRLPMTICS